MATDPSHAIIDALPPHTDYISYLTIVEANLTPQSLPVLHRVLQDEKLTVNIGWDLVHLLLPLLPDSAPCLQTIARLGNPREVLLKATESLRLLDFQSADERASDGDDERGLSAAEDQANTAASLTASQFELLLSLLTTLHHRLRTKYPSRFVATSLAAVIATLAEAPLEVNALLPAALEFARSLTGKKRPALPPRPSTSEPASSQPLSQCANASDPEASSELPSAQEAAILNRLFQSYVLSLAELYISSPLQQAEVPGLAFSDRVREVLAPSKTIPHREPVSERFARDPALLARLQLARNVAQAARDFGISIASLASFAFTRSGVPVALTAIQASSNDDPPQSPDDVPLALHGAIFLLAWSASESVLAGRVDEAVALDIFPQHNAILNSLGDLSELESTVNQSDALIDCALCLGLIALERNAIGAPETDEQFNEYLQRTSIISATSPSPSIRFHAHYLTATILRSHPDENVRLAFIKDTLEHCPYENVKATAVGWIKGEIIEATMGTSGESGSRSLFSSPAGLDLIAGNVFPDLSVDYMSSDVSQMWVTLKMNLGFYLASLNFYWMLLSAKRLHRPLALKSLHTTHDIGGSFLGPLKSVSAKFKASLDAGQLREEEGVEGVEGAKAGLSDLMILDDALERVEAGVTALNQVE